MGSSKPHLLVNNKRLIDIVASKLKPLFDETIVVVKKGMDIIEPYNTVKDNFDGYSPLYGILEGLKNSSSFINFVIACDMPFVQPELIRFLVRKAGETQADVVVPVVNGFYEPLCAVYTKNCIKAIEESIREGNLKVTSFYSKVKVYAVPEDLIKQYDESLWSFVNINTREDLKRVIDIID